MRAVVVLPTPRTPVSIQACGMRPVSKAFDSVRTMASWPIRSSKVRGRYLRARTRYGDALSGAGAGKKPGNAGSSSGGVPGVVWSIGCKAKGDGARGCRECEGGRLDEDPFGLVRAASFRI